MAPQAPGTDRKDQGYLESQWRKTAHLSPWTRRIRRWCGAFPFVALGAAFAIGIIFWGGFNTALEATNTETFCIGCHEMKDFVFQEYRQTIHYENRSGVRATCPDCHVPKDWVHKVVRKVGATNELFHKIIGSIDTREKFEAKRLELAEDIWEDMKRTDSRECRNCHSFSAMKPALQHTASWEQHLTADKEHRTCIDCHKGIAHSLPEEFLEREHERYEAEKIPCSRCHSGMARAPEGDW